MASQRITIAKLAGVSGDVALQRMSAWASARNRANPSLWSPEQWPEGIRKAADRFAEQVREHGFALPVCYFVEWSDMWSMGDSFFRWLTPKGCPGPVGVHADQFEVFAYGLPDDGRLANHLATAERGQFDETDWFIGRLQESVCAWDKLAPRATLVILREALDGSALDEEVTASLTIRPAWLS